MPTVRPAPSPLHLRRRRLVDRLPDAPGFAVWLEAPYGYGKSVLASQWADELEAEGWRVVWTSVAGRDVRAALAGQLELPAAAPWPVLLDALREAPTLVVLEDLTGEEDPGPLLRDGAGLVLLASRAALAYPELHKLTTAGRVQHLTSADLAFGEDEAERVLGDAALARQVWQQTRGWPLPLHFAALTGGLPPHESLTRAVARSVGPEAWRELLFLAAVDLLPDAAATDLTLELARAGFVQRLAGGYRLHPLMAEGVLATDPAAARGEVAANAHRLDPLARGAAFERVGDLEGLRELVEAAGALPQQQPERFLHWHELAPPSADLERRRNVAIANLTLNRFDVALPETTALVAHPELAPVSRAGLLGVALFTLAAAKRFEEAEPFERAALELAPSLPHDAAARLLHNLGPVSYFRGDLAAAEARFRQALAAYGRAEQTPQLRSAAARTAANLQLMLWELHGDVDSMLAAQLELAQAPDLDDGTLFIVHQNLSVTHAYLGDETAAAAALRRVANRAQGDNAVMVRAMLAYFERDVAAFPAILAAARRWESLELAERVSALWLRALRRSGDLDSAFDVYPQLAEGPFTKLELAWALAARGDAAEAARLVSEAEAAYHYREFRVHWLAAAYVVERRPEHLAALLDLTRLREAVLVYAGVPPAALPPGRPELARAYPLAEVLASGWEEAIAARLDEVPPLEVKLLGEVSAAVLGVSVPLTDRQREAVTLLALGVPRERMGEELWPEVDARKQRNSLGVLFTMLRKALEPWGQTTFVGEGGLQRFTLDLRELEAALSAGDAERVLELYVEPFAPGVELPLVDEERQALRERVLEALYAGADADDLLKRASTDREAPAAGEPGVELRVRLLKRLIALDPLHEDAVQALLTLLTRLGRRREARRVYDRFAQALLAETGMEPEAATADILTR